MKRPVGRRPEVTKSYYYVKVIQLKWYNADIMCICDVCLPVSACGHLNTTSSMKRSKPVQLRKVRRLNTKYHVSINMANSVFMGDHFYMTSSGRNLQLPRLIAKQGLLVGLRSTFAKINNNKYIHRRQ